MRSFLISVMTVSLCGGTVRLLCPEGKGDLRKQITFVTALCLCAVLFGPVAGLLGRSLPLSFETEAPPAGTGSAADEILAMTTAEICRELKALVSERFLVADPVLTLTLDKSDLTAVKVTGGRLTAEPPPVGAAAYLSSLLDCPIEAAAPEREEP